MLVDERIDAKNGANAMLGKVRWSASKSLWFIGMLCGWLTFGIAYFSWSAVWLFLATSIVTLCGGHSLGMHRKFIHQSFSCAVWLEWIGVYLGTLVGLGGPRTMMFTHDMRDWAQRQDKCHAFLSHQSGVLKDHFWQLHCKLEFTCSPEMRWPDSCARGSFYYFLQRTSMLQQLPWAILFYTIGGLGWVAWGICGRVVVSIFGHWAIGYRAHNVGKQDWIVEGAAVQGHNVAFAGLISFGECWHNNHHAFPGSARIGLLSGQWDPGWWTLQALSKIGLVSKMTVPADIPIRPNLIAKSDLETASPSSHREPR